ncbi:cytochrome c oxidase subunit iv superfamily [Holotrichia oblita]|uniref:Cytochrome c oxidase subunit iv superfamily n=1 Tax=Holotrichia oblita TaxID=644536 RepID=A0ACB9TPJ6_HOLOL|nr:cytochrome c oxidase subunit iv superfamily [Holotrichia oblita]
MIAYRIGLLGMRPLTITTSRIRPSSLQLRNKADYNKYMESMIGNREMVGYGYNGTPFYADLAAFPFPSIRYKEHTPEIMVCIHKRKLGIDIYGPHSLPKSFSHPYREAQMRRMIDLQVNPIHGLSSNWDYEKKEWKKVGWFTPENPFLEEEEEEEEEVECEE